MRGKLNWRVFTSKARIEAIDEIKEIIGKSGGSILHFNMFSDLGMSLMIEIEENSISQLYRALSQKVRISESLSEDLSDNAETEWIIFMNISFSSEKGNLKQSIPSVPG